MSPPRASRSHVQEDEESLWISVPARRRWGLVLFTGYWCAFMLVALGVTLLGLLAEGPKAFDPVFLGVMLAFLAPTLWMLALLLWALFGRDVLELRGETLTVTKRMPCVEHSHAFSVGDVRDLHATSTTRYSEVFWRPGPILEQWGVTGGRLVFEYQGKTYRYGTGISHGEAQHLVSLLTTRVTGRQARPPAAAPEAAARGCGPLHVVVRPGRQWAQWAFWTLWLMAWLGSGVGLLVTRGGPILRTQPAPLGLLMGAFTALFLLFGGGVLLSWLWVTFGREVIDVSDEELTLRREMPFASRRRCFAVARICRLRVEPRDTGASRLGLLLSGSFWGLSGGPIAFEYDGRTHRFGPGLDEPAARRLVTQIVTRYPTLA